MKSNSYARVACKILKYLNDCYENGLEPSIDSLNANMLGISDRQFYQTMKMLSDDGYVKEVEFMDFVKFLLTVMLSFGTRDFLLTLAQGYLAQKMIDKKYPKIYIYKCQIIML